MTQEDRSRPIGGEPEAAVAELDLRRVLDILLAGKWIILAAMAVGLALGWTYGKLAENRYRGTLVLQVDQRSQSVPGIQEFRVLQTRAPVQGEMDVLASRSLAREVVEALDLDLRAQVQRPPVLGELVRIGATPGQPRAVPVPGSSWLGLARYGWGGERIELGHLRVPEQWRGQGLRLVAGRGGRYRLDSPGGTPLLRGRVGQPSQSRVNGAVAGRVEIRVDALAARPGTVFTVAQADLTAAARRLSSRLAIRERRDGSGVLEVSLTGTEPPAQIERILSELADRYVTRNRERRSRQAQESLDFLEEKLPELRADMREAEERYNQFRTDQQAVDLTARGSQLLNQQVQVESELGELELEISQAQERYGEQHPELQALRDRRAELQERLDNISSQIEALPQAQQRALRLRREMDVASELYTNLLTTAQELRLAQAGDVGNVRIIDEASASGPVQPSGRLAQGAGMLLGFVLAAGGTLAWHGLKRRIDNPEDLESRFGLPTFAVVPSSRRERALARRYRRDGPPRQVLARSAPEDVAVESLRTLRTGLSVTLGEARSGTLLLTSPGPEAGKAFVGTNLAVLAGESGSRVLLVDADLRRSELDAFMVERDRPGLADVMAERAELDHALTRFDDAGVDLLPAGRRPPSPASLFMTESFGDILAQARQRYDLVILVAPPLLAVTDAGIMAPRADSVVLVVRHDRTRLDEITPALRHLDRNGAVATGAVYNDLRGRPRRSDYYAYYERYTGHRG